MNRRPCEAWGDGQCPGCGQFRPHPRKGGHRSSRKRDHDEGPDAYCGTQGLKICAYRRVYRCRGGEAEKNYFVGAGYPALTLFLTLFLSPTSRSCLKTTKGKNLFRGSSGPNYVRYPSLNVLTHIRAIHRRICYQHLYILLAPVSTPAGRRHGPTALGKSSPFSNSSISSLISLPKGTVAARSRTAFPMSAFTYFLFT